ncbi:MAG: hypothetical protein M3A24_06400 [Candidatus Rhabdochlamydia oedothoracis]|nr:hypothetical protein [Candidatus Rhabdochlamydia oedothoracis]
MTSAVKFHSVPKNSYTVTVDLSPSTSNHSCLTRRNIVIGCATGVGIAAIAAVTACYFEAGKDAESLCLNENRNFICETAEGNIIAGEIFDLSKQVRGNFSNCENAFNNLFNKDLCRLFSLRDFFYDCFDVAQSCAQSICSSCYEAADLAQACLEYIPNIKKKRAENGTIYCSHEILNQSINLQDSEKLPSLMESYEYS